MTDNIVPTPDGSTPEGAQPSSPESQPISSEAAVPPAPAPLPPSTPVAAQGAPTPSISPRGVRPAWTIPALTGVAGLVIGALVGFGIASAVNSSNQQAEADAAASASASVEAARVAVLPSAIKTCKLDGKKGLTVSDGGLALTFDMEGKKDTSGTTMDSLNCIFRELKLPESALSHIKQTSSQDGRQTESWSFGGQNLEVSWTYHPDRGLDGVFKVK